MSRAHLPDFILRQVQHRRAQKPRRIGIYAGTFDPVHSGHIAFALQAIEAAKLDEVVFLPERKPRYKPSAEHFGHRVAMLTRAIAPHPQMSVAELVERHFSVAKTLPHVRTLFPHDQLVFLVGSDVVPMIVDWPHYEDLLTETEMVVGVRQGQTEASVHELISTWSVQPKGVITVQSYAASVSSGKVREAIRQGRPQPGVLQSVMRYASSHWLYVQLPGNTVKS